MIVFDNSIALHMEYGVIQIVKSIVRLAGYMVTPIVLIFAMLAKCRVIPLVSCIVKNVICLGMPLFRIIGMIVVVSIGVLQSVHGI